MRIVITSLVLAADLVLPSAARSQTQVTVVPSVSLSTIYDDNIFTTPSRSADQMTQLSPGLEGSVLTPRTSFLGYYSFDAQRSIDHPGLNTIDARRHAILETLFRKTSLLTLSFGGHYDRTQTAGELNFLSGTGLLLERRRADRTEITPSFVYEATPLVTVRGLYDWTREDLAHTMTANEHVARVSVSRQWSPRTSGSIGYLGRHFINGAETQTSNAALFGVTYELDPFTLLSVQAGPRLSSQGTLAPEIVATLGRKAPNMIGYAFDFWRGESIILGVLGPVELTSATGKFAWPVLRNVEIGTSAGLFNSVSLSQGKARVYHAELVASWTPKPFYTIAASYGADFQHGDIRTNLLSDRNVLRHVFLVRLTVAPRLSRIIQPTGPIEPLAMPPSNGVQP